MISSILKYSYIKMIRNRKNIYYILTLVFATILIISSIAVSSYIDDFISKSINNNVGFRTLNVLPNYDYDDYGIKILENNEHILESFNSIYSGITLESSFKNESLNGNITILYGSENNEPDVIMGRKIMNDDTGVAICPKNFYPDDEIDDLKINENLIIKDNELLNKKFILTYESSTYSNGFFKTEKEYKKEFKIIGLYDNTKNLDMNNNCYISKNDMKSIIDVIYSKWDDSSIHSTYSIIDDIKNVDKVIKELKTYGFSSSPKLSIDYEFFNKIQLFAKVIFVIVLIFVLVLSILFLHKKIINELTDIGLLKTVGFSKLNIIFIYLFEITMICFISLIIGFIIFNFVYVLLSNNIFNSFKYIGIDLNNKISFYIKTSLIITIIPIIACLIIILINYRKDASKLIGSDSL